MNKKKFLKLGFSLVLLSGIILTQIPLSFANAQIIDPENFNKENVEIPRLKELPTPSTIELDNGMVIKKASEIYGTEEDTPIFQEAIERIACEEAKIENERDKIEKVLPTPMPEDNNGFYVSVTSELYEPEFTSRVAYVEETYEDIRCCYYDNKEAAVAKKICIVWHYADGKVHLRERRMYVVGINEYYPSYAVMGKIVNTDGSLSYTQGDEAVILNDTGTVGEEYAYEFYINQSYYWFDFQLLMPLSSKLS